MIKGISATFKSNCKKDKVKLREYIIIDNKQVDIKGKLSATAYKNSTFFGTFNMKMLKFETENNINYKKKEFVYYKEVDGEAIKIGTFIVTDVTDSDTFESVNVTAYDYGLKLANPYTTKLDYLSGKITLLQQIKEICTNCDIELENTSLPNGTFIVDSNQFVNGEQYGDVIAQASGINGMFATINSNDKLEFIFQNETDEIIEDYVELDDKRDTHPITSVLVATSEDLETAGAVMKDESLITQYGEHWLKIYSYGYAYSTKKCQDLVSAIFNQVKGFGYSSFKSEYSFLPYLSLGDKIQFRNKEGNLVNSIILKYETDYDEITFEAPSIINASVEYELPETPENIAKKAMITVNQSVGEIRGEVTKVESKVEDITTTTQTSTGGNSLYLKEALESNALEYSIDGKCEQATRSGKNLYNSATITAVSNGTNNNGVITSNTFSTNNLNLAPYNIVNLEAGTYYLSADIRIISGTPTINKINDYISDAEVVSKPTLSTTKQRYVYKKTYTSATKLTRMLFQFNASANAVVEVSNIMISKENTNYEPYGASPSPDYPSEIKTIKGIRNLFNKDEFEKQLVSGKIKNDNGVEIADNTSQYSTYYIPINKNILYSFNGYFQRIYLYDKNKTWVGRILGGSGIDKMNSTYTPTIDGYIQIQIHKTTYDNNKGNEMITKGSVAHSYVPYGTYEKIKVTGKNWFDKDNTYTAIGEASGYVSSDYIPVKKGDTINKTNSVMFWFYDKSKNQIGFASGSTTTTVSLDNVAYVRCNVLKTDLDTFMLTINQELTDYEPYKEKEVLIDLAKENLLETPYTESNKLTATATKNDYYAAIDYYAELEAGKTYTFSCKTDGTFGASNQQTQCYLLFDKKYDYIIHMDDKNCFKFTPTQTGKYYVRYDVNVKGETHSFWDFAIYKGTNADSSYELNSIGDTKDKLEIVNGVAVIQKKIGKVVLNGTENWHKAEKGYLIQNNNTPFANNNSPFGYCDKFKFQNSYITWTKQYYCGFNSTNTFWIRDDFAIATTVEEFKSWLKVNPVTVYYILNEPETITLPNTNIPLYEGINHVTLVEDLETTTSIKYLRKTPISGEYALNQDLNKTNSNLADTNNQLSQTQSDIDNTKTNLNNNYYNKEQVDSINSTTTQNITQIRNTMEQNITSTNASISKIQEEITNGVSKVTTTTGTFDENGLNISKSGQQMSSTLDWDGLEVVRDKGKATETEVLTVRSAGVEAENMTVRNFFIKRPIRIEKCKSITDSTKVGLGFFWIGE